MEQVLEEPDCKRFDFVVRSGNAALVEIGCGAQSTRVCIRSRKVATGRHATSSAGRSSAIAPRSASSAIADRGFETRISDDAPGERRRRSLDERAERACTLNGQLLFEPGDNGGMTVRVLLPPHASAG